MKGLIFDIQGYSVHDGTGCRTLVLLSGCPLRCTWCSNPEGQLLRPRLLYRESRCIHTHYRCVSACPHSNVRIEVNGSPPLWLNRSVCNLCDTMECVEACRNEALAIAGRLYTVDELVRILVRDQGFWGDRGGVTFGGGEPLFQPEFLSAVLAECRSAYMHTAVETSAHTGTDILLDILPRIDWMFIDLKHMDPAAHRAGTGASNNLILKNIQAVASAGWKGRLIIRVPVVPGFNDSVDNLRATADFMARLGLKEVNLLPFHRLGYSKHEQLGLNYEYARVPALSLEAARSHRHIFEAAGLQCYIGSETPF